MAARLPEPSMARHATIIATGRYLPEIEVPNSVLREQLAHVPDFIDKMEAGTGIRKRWYAPDGWATSDLALRAAQCALARAGRKPEDVDLIILGTDSPDYITPATSVVLQHKLGAKKRRHLRRRLRLRFVSNRSRGCRRSHRRQPLTQNRAGSRGLPHAQARRPARSHDLFLW